MFVIIYSKDTVVLSQALKWPGTDQSLPSSPSLRMSETIKVLLNHGAYRENFTFMTKTEFSKIFSKL